MNLLAAMTPELSETFVETAKVLKGHQRRLFMARVVKSFGRGGMSFAQKEFGWNEGTMRKGKHELRTGIECVDAVNQRGRQKAEEKLPKLLEDRLSGILRDWFITFYSFATNYTNFH